MTDLSVQRPVFQPSTPTTNGHKAPQSAPSAEAPSAARRPMPKWIQPFTQANPIAHFRVAARSLIVRGASLEVVHLPLCVLVLIATVLVGFSAWRFRGRLS